MTVRMDLLQTLTADHGLSATQQQEIRKGAYIVILDNGAFYNTHTGTTRCATEHNSSAPVYDISGEPGNVLVGLTREHHTWVQWERSRCLTFQHAWDWALYMWSGQNQGPYGASVHTEKNPITLGGPGKATPTELNL